MSMWILGSLALTIVVAWLTMKPLLVAHGNGAQDTVTDPLFVRADAKERALRSLKDLEFDYKMGKLSADDYADVKAKISAEVARLLSEE